MARNIDRLELPQWYDENTMTMLAVSPDTVFLYWELAFGQAKALRERQLVLKLYQLPPESAYGSEKPRLVINVQLPPLTNNWYFHKLEPACRYRTEMGWENNNRFYSFIKSNTVTVPPANPANATTALRNQWRLVNMETTPQPKFNEQTFKATVQEVIDSMSFYMGIRKVDSSERK